MIWGLGLLLFGACLLDVNNGINNVEFTSRNVFLTLVGAACIYLGGLLMGLAWLVN